MCDEDDEEIVPLGGDLHKHLLANGLCDFEVYERSPRRIELNTHIKKMETKLKSMSFLNMFVPYQKSNLSLIREIRDCHLLLEEDALYLESLCNLDVAETTNLLRTICISTAIALPIMLLCHVPRTRLLSITCTGFGLFSIRQVIASIRQGIDQKMMRGLINTLKGFSAICRKSQSLAQEWDMVAGNMNILKDTALFRAKMCGIDDLKSDLVRFLRLCVINLTESSRDIVNITSGNDLHPLCMEVMRSEVMIEQNSSLSKAKKLHYLLVLVQSDYLKNVAVGFMPSAKPMYNMAACAATVKNCISYTTQYIEECTRILTDKYEVLKNFTPQAKMTESVYKLYNRVSTFGDVRQTVNNITVCLEALTLQSLLAQRALERYDESAVNKPSSTSIVNIDHVCNSTQDALLGLQADLHSTQCSVELAVKQLTRLRRTDFEKCARSEPEPNIRLSEPQTNVVPMLNLSDLPDNIRDEVFELCERSSLDDFDDIMDQPSSLQETIQRRAEQRVAGRLLKELKTALMGKRAEMTAREELARASNQNNTPLMNMGRNSSTQTQKPSATKSEINTSTIVKSIDKQNPIANSSSRNISMNDNSKKDNSENDLEIDEKIVEPDVCVYKSVENLTSSASHQIDNNVVDSVLDIFSIADITSSATLQSNIDNNDDFENPSFTEKEMFPKSKQLEQVLLDQHIGRDSSLESMLTARGFSDLSIFKDLESADEEKAGSEFDFALNDNLHDYDRYMEVEVLSKVNDFYAVSSSDDGRVDSEIRVKAESPSTPRSSNMVDEEFSISTGDYLLNDLPKRAKPQRKHPSSRQRYKYEPESGDNRVMGFRLPDEAVTKAREFHSMGSEECFGNSD